MISTHIAGCSHWLNRLQLGGREVDVDLTGDQFGLPPIQIKAVGQLYPDTRVRGREELNEETLERARTLARRTRLGAAARALEAELRKRKVVLDRA
jgi:hypothetical protein